MIGFSIPEAKTGGRLFALRLRLILGQIRGGECRDLLPLLGPDSGQFTDFFRFVGRQIVRFAAVAAQVIELPWTVFARGDDLPVADAEGAIALVQPPD